MDTITPHDERMMLRMQALAEPTRLAIVRLLAGGERCVCDVQAALDAAQSRLSFHLKKLKDAGLVDDRRDGRWVHYRLVPESLEEVRDFLGAVDTGVAGVRDVSACCV